MRKLIFFCAVYLAMLGLCYAQDIPPNPDTLRQIIEAQRNEQASIAAGLTARLIEANRRNETAQAQIEQLKLKCGKPCEPVKETSK